MTAPSIGESMVIDGGPFAAAMLTPTAADIPTFPTASRACACSECGPAANAAVFQLMPYGAVVSEPMDVPSTRNVTEATPTLSDAFAVIVTLPLTCAPAIGDEMTADGGVVSELGGGSGATSRGPDRRRHVRLNVRRGQRDVVDADFVDRAREILSTAAVATNLQRSVRGVDASRPRRAGDLDTVDIHPERRPVVGRRQVRPRVDGNRRRTVDVARREGTARRRPRRARGHPLEVVIVVALVDDVAPL